MRTLFVLFPFLNLGVCYTLHVIKCYSVMNIQSFLKRLFPLLDAFGNNNNSPDFVYKFLFFFSLMHVDGKLQLHICQEINSTRKVCLHFLIYILFHGKTFLYLDLCIVVLKLFSLLIMHYVLPCFVFISKFDGWLTHVLALIYQYFIWFMYTYVLAIMQNKISNYRIYKYKIHKRVINSKTQLSLALAFYWARQRHIKFMFVSSR